MTVDSTQTKQVYQGNGATTIFPVPFPYSETETITLLYANANDKETIITSNYKITTNSSGDTSVIYPIVGDPIGQGTKLTLYRNTPLTQVVSLIEGGAFNPRVLENHGFDRIVMMIQELKEELNRSIKVARHSDKTPEDLIAQIFSKQNESVHASEESKRTLCLTTNQANIAIDASNKSSASAQDALHALESVISTVASIEGFSKATQTFYGVYVDENFQLVGVKAEDGDTVNVHDFFYYAILPTEAHFFLEGGKLALELPFTQ